MTLLGTLPDVQVSQVDFETYQWIKFKYILYIQSECLNNVSILGGFTTKHGYFCHPNTNMSAKNLNEAQLECLNDQSCDMFYRVCDYPDSRFRKCTNTAEAEYQDPSTCGDILGQSSLYIRGNTFGIWCFHLSIDCNISLLLILH